MKLGLFIVLGVVGGLYLTAVAGAVVRARRAAGAVLYVPSALELLLGFLTNFFDTLGIGSFAPTTAVLKLRRLVPDEHIPGTLNVGHTLPTITQAFLFIAGVNVDVVTLTLMIGAAVAGSWLGAGVVSGWPRRNIQLGMGAALLVAATLFLMQIFEKIPGGGTEIGLTGAKLVIGIAVNFVLGALMEVGVGLYGPCMILVSLLGMNPQTAFPIMMGSCAFLMPIGSLKFIKHERYGLKASLGLGLGGIPAVLIAFYIVKSLPLLYLRWLVVVVVLYAALSMLRSAATERSVAAQPPEGTPPAHP
jgi:uncharacterized membrane protein YfcA